jgi:hypothetical protein
MNDDGGASTVIRFFCVMPRATGIAAPNVAS